MLSSQKVFYLVLISIMLLCSIFNISVQGTNTYYPADNLTVESVGNNSEIVAELSDLDDDESGFDSTSIGVDVSVGEQTTTEEGYVYNADVSIIETTTTTLPTSESTETQQTESTTSTEQLPVSQSTDIVTVTAPTTTMTTTTTTTTRPTTTTTRITTTTRPTTTTTTKNYKNSGSISFSLSSGGSTVTEYRMYAGSSVRLYLKSGFGETPIAVYTTDHSYIANATSNDVGSVVITAYSVGTTWIHASNVNGTCHIKITVDDFESRVVYLCNQYRAASGIAPLEVGGSELKTVADLRLSEIYGTFSHTRPNGTQYKTAYDYCGVTYYHIGENLARGQTTPEQVVEDWMNSEKHRANIMDASFKYCSVSIGTAMYDGYMYTYWSQQFYTPRS